ncbi:MAG: right-handed parallel beta-helix repeat-containing protein, partial [Spirochaetes bacterium]|nr:right-handed parallel beta-helix repeat-containing protein [Spirochaetota bacterium]
LSQPFKTIQKAADVMSTNVTVASCYIFPGNYSEQVEIYSNKNNGYMVFLALSNNKPKPVLSGASYTNYGFHITNTSKVIVRDLVIKLFAHSGIYITGASTNNHFIKNTIYSNNTNGIFINSEESDGNYILTNNIYGPDQVYGIKISDGDSNTIASNQIHNHDDYGIYIFGNPSYTHILNNSFYSNMNYGLYVEDAKHADILSNMFWGENQNYGIYLIDTGSDQIKYNQFFNQTTGIFYNGSPSSNYIVKNDFYFNTNSIVFGSGGIDDNFILSNYIRGQDSTVGIDLGDSDNNTVRSNIISYNNYGILINGAGTNNVISKNIVCSNGYGIFIDVGGGDNNYILSNHLWGSNQTGIYINDGDGNEITFNQIHHQSNGIYLYSGNNQKIYRNLIYNNNNYGIRILGGCTNIKIINNTIFNSMNDHGVSWENTSSGTMYNNIILSNGDGDDYGISRTSTGSVFAAYNCIYGNKNGETNGGLTWGNGNIFADPMIDTVLTFMITSATSSAVDSGTNIPGVTDGFLGSGPDMGWREGIYQGTGLFLLFVFPDKEEGQYIGDLNLKMTVYKDILKQEISPDAAIMVTVFRNDILSRSLSDKGTLNIALSAGAKYRLDYYAEEGNNTSAFEKAEYIVLKETEEDLLVYPTVVNIDEGKTITILLKEKKSNADIKIYTLRGDMVKEIIGADFSTGSYKWDTQKLQSLPAGPYILRIEDKKSLLLFVK